MQGRSEIAKRRRELQEQKKKLLELQEQKKQATSKPPRLAINGSRSGTRTKSGAGNVAICRATAASVNVPPTLVNASGDDYQSPTNIPVIRDGFKAVLGEDGYRPGGSILPKEEIQKQEDPEDLEGTEYNSKKCPLVFAQKLSHNTTESRPVAAIEFHRKFEDVILTGHAQRSDGKPGAVKGIVCVWSLESGGDKLQRSLVSQSPITALELPMISPTVVIAGTKGGRIVMWDTRVKTSLPISSFANDGSNLSDFHDRYPITSVKSTSSSSQYFLTTSSGGHVCKWSLAKPDCPVDKTIVPDATGAGELPIECLDFPQTARLFGDELGASNRSTAFFVGAQDGGVYRMEGSTSEWKPDGKPGEHAAAITALHSHPCGSKEPFLDDTILTSSRDWTIGIRHYARGGTCEELSTFDMAERGVVHDVAWNSIHSTVFCAGDASGTVSLFDISGLLNPSRNKSCWSFHIPEAARSPVTRVQWDRNGKTLCAGDKHGNVGVWESRSHFAGLPDEAWTAQYLRSKVPRTA